MNASELAAVYEPLWAAVPETRPDNHTPEFGDWIRSHVIEGAAAFVAAALCRVAAEDWLTKQCSPYGFGIGEPNGYEHPIGVDTPDGWVTGPTIHHALVAACLAVHSASPSAAPPS